MPQHKATGDRETALSTLADALATQEVELAALIADLAGSAGVVELDQTRQGRLSRMDAMAQQEMARSTTGRHSTQLLRVRAALARVRGGSFGDCCRCDEQIPVARLQADPATPFCLDCTEQAEAAR